jgi:hypothetical protein
MIRMERPDDSLPGTETEACSPADAAPGASALQTDRSLEAPPAGTQSQPADETLADPETRLRDALKRMDLFTETSGTAEGRESGGPRRVDPEVPSEQPASPAADAAQPESVGAPPDQSKDRDFEATGSVAADTPAQSGREHADRRDSGTEMFATAGAALAAVLDEPAPVVPDLALGSAPPSVADVGLGSASAPMPDAADQAALSSPRRTGPLSVAPPKPPKPTSSRPPPPVASTAQASSPPQVQPASTGTPAPLSPPPPKPPAEQVRLPEGSGVVVPDFRASRRRPFGWVLAMLAVGALVAAVVILAWPRQGQLTITALAPGGGTVGQAQVAVDGRIRCEGAPCTVADLTSGEHTIRVSSAEYGPADRVVAMKTGFDHSVDVLLEHPKQALVPAAPPASANAAPQASAEQPDRLAADRTRARTGPPAGPSTGTIKANSLPVSKVLVDGRSAGQTPANIHVAPGTHTVTFVHAEYGRRDVVVDVKSRQDAVVAIKFHPGEH